MSVKLQIIRLCNQPSTHTNTTKRRHEVLISLFSNFTNRKDKWYWILQFILAYYTGVIVIMYEDFLTDKCGWVNWYLVGKFVKKDFYALELFEKMSEKGSEEKMEISHWRDLCSFENTNYIWNPSSCTIIVELLVSKFQGISATFHQYAISGPQIGNELFQFKNVELDHVAKGIENVGVKWISLPTASILIILFEEMIARRLYDSVPISSAAEAHLLNEIIKNDVMFRNFYCPTNPVLSQEIACYMGLELEWIMIKGFADEEINVQLHDSVRGCDVYLVQPTCLFANENFMELLVMSGACRLTLGKMIHVNMLKVGLTACEYVEGGINGEFAGYKCTARSTLHYKKLLESKSSDGLSYERKLVMLCKYAAKSPFRSLKIAKSLEDKSYKELKLKHNKFINMVVQMACFAVKLVNVVTELLDNSKQETMCILGCQTLMTFIYSQTYGNCTHTIAISVHKVSKLACQCGGDHQGSGSSSLQCLSAMVPFLVEFSYIFVDFDEIVHVSLDNYEPDTHNEDDVKVTQLDDTKLSYLAKHTLISIGSRVQRLVISGKELGTFSVEALSWEELPKHVVALREGYIAIEWRKMGASVNLFSKKKLPLRGLDDEIKAVVALELKTCLFTSSLNLKIAVKLHLKKDETTVASILFLLIHGMLFKELLCLAEVKQYCVDDANLLDALPLNPRKSLVAQTLYFLEVTSRVANNHNNS